MRKPARLGNTFLIAVVMLCKILAAAAIPAAGMLSGVVLNNAGMPVAAAQVSWQSADGKAPHATHTDGSGHFRITGVRPGLYEVRAQAGGKWSDWEHNVLVRSSADASITLRLMRTLPGPRP